MDSGRRTEFTLFPAVPPALASYLAGLDELGNTAIQPGPLLDVAPAEGLVQGAKYWLGARGLRYSISQDFTYTGVPDTPSGSPNMGYYTVKIFAKWAVYESPASGSAGWLSAEVIGEGGARRRGREPERDERTSEASPGSPAYLATQRRPRSRARLAAVAGERAVRRARRRRRPEQLPRHQHLREHRARPVPELRPHQLDGAALAPVQLRRQPPVATRGRVVRDPRRDGRQRDRGRNAVDRLLLGDLVRRLGDRLRTGRLSRPRRRRLPHPAVSRARRRADPGGSGLQLPAAARPRIALCRLRPVRRRRLAGVRGGLDAGRDRPRRQGAIPGRSTSSRTSPTTSRASASSGASPRRRRGPCTTATSTSPRPSSRFQLSPMSRFEPDLQLVWNPVFNAEPGPYVVVQAQFLLSW